MAGPVSRLMCEAVVSWQIVRSPRLARASSAARYSAPPLWPGFSQISCSSLVARARSAV